MRVLFLDHAPALGGAEKSLLLILEHLDRSGFEPLLGCTGGPLAEAAARMGVEIATLDFPRLRRSLRAPADLAAGARRIARLAAGRSVDLIYANTVRAAVFGSPAARIARLPFVWHMRDFWLSESAPRFRVFDVFGKRLVGAGARHIIANSHAVARGLPYSGKVAVVYNGIDLAAFDPLPEAAETRAGWNIPAGVPVVGMVGRLRPWKGVDRYLRIAKQIQGKLGEVHFLVVGGAPFGDHYGYAASLPGLAAALGLSEHVHFTGHLDDVRPALAAMDVFVHPGDPEPFGLVNIEAMAAGKPVVAFAHGALPEIVVDGVTGLLAPPGDEAALAEAVAVLLENPDLGGRLGRAGRERVEQKFTSARMVDQIAGMLARIARRR